MTDLFFVDVIQENSHPHSRKVSVASPLPNKLHEMGRLKHYTLEERASQVIFERRETP